MADLTIGDIGNSLVINLVCLDSSVSPPAQIPLDLTDATAVNLLFTITAPGYPAKVPKTVAMSIVGSPTNGQVQYVFQSGDLAAPPEMGKNGVFRFSIQIQFQNGNVLYTDSDGLLSIKNDAEV